MRRTFTSVLVWLSLIASTPAQQTPQAVELQAAIRTETVLRDLKKAIAQYQQIVDKYAKSDRAVAADALVRMADCHQKLGDQQAIRLFERVMREFGDQKTAVEFASARLEKSRGRTTAVTAGITNRQVWTGEDVDPEGTISADGRYLSYTDWSTGDLGLRDMTTGTNRRLTNKGTWNDSSDFSEESTISRDGEYVAYAWYDDETERYQLRMLRSNATAGSTPRVLVDNPDIGWIAPYDWSPDGKRLAVQVQRSDRSAQIGLVDVASGSYRPLKSTDWRGATRMFFSPDGAVLAYDLPQEEGAEGRDVFVLGTNGTGEHRVAPHSAYDVACGWSPDGRSILFASDRSGSFGLWKVDLTDGKPTGTPTLLKNDLGALMSSVGVTRTGALFYGVRTSAATVAIAPIDLEGARISPPTYVFETYVSTIRAPDWSHDGKRIAVIARDGSNRRSTLSIRNSDGTHIRELPLAMGYAQRPRWAPDGSITLQGRDLKGRRGFFRVDPASGDLRPVLLTDDKVNALQLSWLPDGKSLVYRRSIADKSAVVLRDIASGDERVLVEHSGLVGLSLSPDARVITFISNDRSTKTSTLSTMSIDGGARKEVIRLVGDASLINFVEWTPDGRQLLFGKSEAGAMSTWIVPATGGAARKIDGLSPGVRLHPDGRQAAYHVGSNAIELWTLENFLPRAAAISTRTGQ